MAGEWIPMNLGAACTKIGSGATPRGGGDVYLAHGPFALIRSQNVYNDGFHHDGLAYIGEKHAAELDGVEVLEDDVLLNITGDSVARACQVDPRVLPARVNQHVAIIRPDPERLDPRFLRYFLVSPEMQAKLLSWAGSGGTRNALTKGTIESFNVPAPEDIAEQRAIAYILGTLDDKIELNRGMNETLEAMARVLFKSWFVDFDPVRAKAAGQDPGLPKDIADPFSARLVDSKLGEIPEGWEVEQLGAIVEVVLGGTPSTSVEGYWNGSVPWAAARDITQAASPMLLTTERSISQDGLNHSNARLLPAGTTVVTARGTVGVHRMLGRPMAINQTSYALLPKGKGRALFIYFILGTLLEELKQRSYGTVFDTITSQTLRGLSFVLPPNGVMTAFEEHASPLMNRLLGNSLERQSLAALRDALLPKLISGELRVPDPNRFLREALQ